MYNLLNCPLASKKSRTPYLSKYYMRLNAKRITLKNTRKTFLPHATPSDVHVGNINNMKLSTIYTF
jgi:hypothetical protein